jgi:hypothetical protein
MALESALIDAGCLWRDAPVVLLNGDLVLIGVPDGVRTIAARGRYGEDLGA